jgi:hypothetical protein
MLFFVNSELYSSFIKSLLALLDRLRDSMLEKLEKNFRRRFNVKALPCAD